MKKQGKLKGCLKKAAIPICLIAVCVVVMLLTAIPLLPKFAHLTDYAKMLEELSVQVKDSDMSQNPINWQDNKTLQEKVNAFVECKELDEHGNPKSLFDITGAFIYDNIKKDNINIKQSSLELDKRNLGAFVNSLIGAGWIEGFYDKGDARKFLSVLDVLELTTQDGITNLSVIVKTNINFLGDEASSKDGINTLDNYLYITYNTRFKGNEILSADMHFNKISEKSNQLFLETLFSSKDQEVINKNVSSIIEEVLKQLNKIRTEWDMTVYFDADKLVIAAN